MQCRDSIGIGLQPAQLSDQLFETLSPLVQRLIETNHATNSIRNEDMIGAMEALVLCAVLPRRRLTLSIQRIA